MLGSLETPLQRNKSRTGDIAQLVEHWSGLACLKLWAQSPAPNKLGMVESTEGSQVQDHLLLHSQPGIHEICFKEDKKKMSNNKKN